MKKVTTEGRDRFFLLQYSFWSTLLSSAQKVVKATMINLNFFQLSDFRVTREGTTEKETSDFY